MKCNIELIDHEQITTKCLWNDGIHLLDKGKSMLRQNFVNRVSNFFRKNNWKPYDRFLNLNQTT